MTVATATTEATMIVVFQLLLRLLCCAKAAVPPFLVASSDIRATAAMPERMSPGESASLAMTAAGNAIDISSTKAVASAIRS